MKIVHLMRFACSCLFVLLCFCSVTIAQTETATISGLVTDYTGASVPGAQVKLQSVDRGTVQSAQTNNAGIYVFASLQPGQYQITVQKVGFKQVDFLGLIINVQDHIEQNFRLQIGSVSESVTVEANGLNLNTTGASVSTVVDQSYIKNMPLNGRSFQDLILLTPGVVNQSPQNGVQNGGGIGATGEFSVNGQRTESNYYTVDGVSASLGTISGSTAFGGPGASGSLAASTALGTTQALVSVDALQEFRVQSSTYSAEYGRNPGGQFAFETKSGTNQWHGTAFDYLRNGAFDAQDWFNNYFNTPLPELRQNDFGGTLGGPLTIPSLYNGKDRTFFFVSYEGLRLQAPVAANVNLVPDAALRANAPAPLSAALNAFPLPSPNGMDFGNGIAQFIGSWSNPASLDSTSVRLDHWFNEKVRIFFRFSDTQSTASARQTTTGGGTPSVNDKRSYVFRTYTAGMNNTLSNRVNNELRFNYSSNEVSDRVLIDSFGGNTPVNLAQLEGLGSNSNPGVVLCYEGCPLLYQAQAPSRLSQWNLVDTLGISLGHHQLKLGFDYRRLATFAQFSNPQVFHEYFSEAAVLANSADTFIAAYAPGYPLYKNFSTFAQDEWRVTPRLSLSLGLRWEINPAPGVTQGLKPYTYILQGMPSSWTLAPQGTELWRTTWGNVAPRVGAAYILNSGAGRETIIRGGVGLFYDTGQQLGSVGLNGGPGFAASTPCCPVGPFPTIPGGIPSIVNPPQGQQSIGYAFDPHLELPYTLQWNVALQQGLGASQALSVSYVGSHSDRLLEQQQFLTPSSPAAGFFEVVRNGLTSDYDAAQVQFQRRLRGGLTALASYTLSHCMDYGSSNVSLGYERGNCDFDVRHNLTGAVSYDLPRIGHETLWNALLDHWGLDGRITARTAFPVTLLGNNTLQPDGQLLPEGLNIVAGQPVYLYGANCAKVLQGIGDLAPGQGCPGGRAINPSAFIAPASGAGDAPRNFARGFNAWQINLAVRREFRVYENLKLQFRAEAFNVFNHPSFGYIDPYFGDSTFGQATASLASSSGVLNPLYQSGGSRSMQFALKLVF